VAVGVRDHGGHDDAARDDPLGGIAGADLRQAGFQHANDQDVLMNGLSVFRFSVNRSAVACSGLRPHLAGPATLKHSFLTPRPELKLGGRNFSRHSVDDRL
jgi:hypothetical protein